MKNSTIAMLVAWGVYGFILYSIARALGDTWQRDLFFVLMIAIFFGVVFSKTVNKFLEDLDGD